MRPVTYCPIAGAKAASAAKGWPVASAPTPATVLMAKANGGKNPLTPLSNSDFQALASSLSNLETGQSDEQYQRNVQRVIDLYTRAYQGAGGMHLEQELNAPVGGQGSGAGLGALPQIGNGGGAAPGGGNPGILVPNDIANAIRKGRLSDEQAAAYDAFMSANPNATVEQLQAFAQSMGLSVANAGGGAYGLGSGEGVSDRLLGAGSGAATGGALGGALTGGVNALARRAGRSSEGNPGALGVYEAAQRQPAADGWQPVLGGHEASSVGDRRNHWQAVIRIGGQRDRR